MLELKIVRRVSEDEVNGLCWESRHEFDAVAHEDLSAWQLTGVYL